jgi:RHS repeat-associated protein
MHGFRSIRRITAALAILFAIVMAASALGARPARADDADSDGSPHPGKITNAKAGFLPTGHSSGRTAGMASAAATAAPSAPFTQCPPVGYDTSCALLADITDSGVTILQDPSQGPYDGVEDTLIGIVNQSSKSLGHLSLGSNTDMFGFDGDGICSFEYTIDPGCPFGSTGYEGPGTSFTEISADYSSGVVNFEPSIPPGGSAYFSLEEPLSASTVVSGGPSPIEQGGAPNGTEKRTTCSQGHPVNCATGVLWHEFTDAHVPGRGVPLEFSRTYSSMKAAEDGPLGFGWSNSYGMSLSIDGETGAATIHEEGGSAVTFPANGEGGFPTPPRVMATLEANDDGSYAFTRFSNHVSYVFSAAGQLLREVDRNGNETKLSYSGGRLEEVTDPSGRSLDFTYVGSHIHTVTDPMGRTTTFAYDANGDLTETIDPLGRTWSFTYDGSHRLLTMTDPRGGTVSSSYDGSGRVVSQTDPLGRESTWSYEGEAASTEGGTTTFTDGRGNVTRYDYRDLELRSVTRGVGSGEEATTSYQYDPITLGVTAVTDPDGNTTHNKYDNHGNLVETTDPLFRTAFYSYGVADELLYATDPAGTTTSYRYDADGNLLEKETPDYQTGETAVTRYGYEADPGELTKVTAPDGREMTIAYDDAGNRTAVTDPGGNKTTYAYDADGEPTSKVSPAGNRPGGNPSAHTSTFTYDAGGELTAETDPLGHGTSYAYDGNGNLKTITDANGHTTHEVYDADDEVTEVIRPDGSVLKTTWDAAGNMTAQIDGAGQATIYAYDALDRLVGVTDPNGHTTGYGYDPAGRRVEMVDPEGQTTEYGYDGAGQLTSIEYSDGITPNVYEVYDQDGNRIELFDGTGASTFDYDSLNRLISTSNGAGETVGYAYDLAGHLTKLTYPNGESVTRAFDSAGNLESVTDWLGHTTRLGYDPESNLSEEEYGNGVTTQIAHDAAGQITSIVDSHGATQLASFSYTRDPLGQVSSEIDHNGETSSIDYSRDSLDQLTEAASSSYGYDAADNPTTFGAAAQQFDPADELTGITETGEGPPEEGELPPPGPPPGGGGSPPGSGETPAGGGGNPSSGPAPSPAPASRSALHCRKGFKKRKVHGKKKCVKARKKRHSRSHSHARVSSASAGADAAGPSLASPAAAETGAPLSSASAAANGVQTSSTEVTRQLTYDERGDRTTEELPGGGVRFLEYDQADRLVAVGGDVAYAYDGDGLRAAKTVAGVTTTEIWNQAEALPELLQSGSTSYVYGPSGQPVEQIAGGVATFMQLDQQGSVRLLTNEGGAAAGRYDYDPWGRTIRHAGSAGSELQFDGQLTDAETGYQYLRARYYDPGTGQFLSTDPLQPISRSRYGFGENNPLSFGDASGEWLGVDTLLGTAIGAVVGTVSGAGGYGVSVVTGNENFSWRQLGASTGGGLIGGAAAGACEGTTWVGTVACGAAGGAVGGATTEFLSGHFPSAGDLLEGGVVGGLGGGLGKLLYPLRGFVPYKLSNVIKPGINSLRMYGQNAVSGLTGIVAQLLWC